MLSHSIEMLPPIIETPLDFPKPPIHFTYQELITLAILVSHELETALTETQVERLKTIEKKIEKARHTIMSPKAN